MTIAVVTLAIAAAGLAGSLVWMLHLVVKATDEAGDARVAQVATEAELDQKGFELEQTKRALTAMDKLAAGLETTLAEYLNAAPNTDLAADDVRGRVLRISQEWARAARADRLPAISGEIMSPDAPAEAPVVDLRNPDGPDV